jgi:hydroxymethylbilane synthase
MRIGTRSSALALQQAHTVRDALGARGIDSELVQFTTVGDQRLDQSLSAIGAKGLFTHELETALSNGTIDCAVHSLKDLPTEQPAGLRLVAILPRVDPRDVLVVNRTGAARTLADLPAGAMVGTSSLRRRAQLLALRPDLSVVELRGNVPTRLRKIHDGPIHAAILAAAGLIRLGATEHITSYLDAPNWLSAAGQGAIAVQARVEDPDADAAFAPLDDASTRCAVTAERAMLAALEGGCQVPIGAVVVDGWLHGMIASVDGTQVLRGSRPVDPVDPACAGRTLAEDLRARGATELLMALRA